MEDLFKETTYGKLALEKLQPTGENFMLYEAGWLGKGVERDVMEVKGATFRAAKSGPRKGQICVIVPGSQRTAYVTSQEIRAAKGGAA